MNSSQFWKLTIDTISLENNCIGIWRWKVIFISACCIHEIWCRVINLCIKLRSLGEATNLLFPFCLLKKIHFEYFLTLANELQDFKVSHNESRLCFLALTWSNNSLCFPIWHSYRNPCVFIYILSAQAALFTQIYHKSCETMLREC